jgi:mono/diheme cytochrome c family protein
MRGTRGIRKLMLPATLVGIAVGIGAAGCGLFQSEQVAKGQKLYAHYCIHCHGENGRQNEGYNWAQMPDPRPKDLSDKDEMGTFKDQEVFDTISRDMKDTTPEKGDKIGEDEFAVPTMPTFKYTLSEEEIWNIVAYVRTLHGTKLSFDIEGRKKEMVANLQKAQQTFDAAEKKADEEADKKGTEEKEALVAAKKDLDKAKTALTNFSARPKLAAITRPDLTLDSDQAAKLAETGKRLYLNKYGCNACHQVGAAGGVVGPGLDRSGFRLNSAWVYRWIKYPQSMKPDTRMPNLGLSDSDAKAVTMYLSTLKASPPDQPVTKAAR